MVGGLNGDASEFIPMVGRLGLLFAIKEVIKMKPETRIRIMATIYASSWGAVFWGGLSALFAIHFWVRKAPFDFVLGMILFINMPIGAVFGAVLCLYGMVKLLKGYTPRNVWKDNVRLTGTVAGSFLGVISSFLVPILMPMILKDPTFFPAAFSLSRLFWWALLGSVAGAFIGHMVSEILE